MLGQAGQFYILNVQSFYVFYFFVVMLEIVGSLKLISHPRHSNILGGGGWESNEHDTKFMPTSLRGVPNQNLWFTSSFSRSEHRHWHNWWGTGTRMWIPWTHLHVKTKSNYLPLPVSSFYWPAVHLMLVTRSTEAIFLLSIMSIKINWLLAASQASPWLHYC